MRFEAETSRGRFVELDTASSWIQRLVQLFSQISAVADVQSGGVAYAAHVGGFIFGVISARFFERFASTPIWADD